VKLTRYFFNLYYIGRVAVTSSPLYQPMDELERLGYELRIYVRVPDLGMSFHAVSGAQILTMIIYR
jgi:hypothetical protein